MGIIQFWLGNQRWKQYDAMELQYIDQHHLPNQSNQQLRVLKKKKKAALGKMKEEEEEEEEEEDNQNKTNTKQKRKEIKVKNC